MRIKGNKILLRELQERDMNLLYEMINDSDVENTIVGWSKPVTLKEQIDWFNNLSNDNNIRFAISNLEDSETLGTIIISKIDWKNKSCSIDIKIGNKFQHLGYGNDSIKSIINYIFEQLNFNRIFVNILEYNEGSKKLFEKNGFKLEGTQRQAIYKNGKYNSLLLYGLIKDDYVK